MTSIPMEPVLCPEYRTALFQFLNEEFDPYQAAMHQFNEKVDALTNEDEEEYDELRAHVDAVEQIVAERAFALGYIAGTLKNCDRNSAMITFLQIFEGTIANDTIDTFLGHHVRR